MDERKPLFFGLRIFRGCWLMEWEKILTFVKEEEEVNICDVKSSKNCVNNMIRFISKQLLYDKYSTFAT
jgi:hypothetical protein